MDATPEITIRSRIYVVLPLSAARLGSSRQRSGVCCPGQCATVGQQKAWQGPRDREDEVPPKERPARPKGKRATTAHRWAPCWR